MPHRFLTALAAIAVTLQGASGARSIVAERITHVTRESTWKRIAAVPIAFKTYHPQGMVKTGDTLFVSSVEVTVRTARLADRTGRYDRDAGKGVGHLFKIDMQGRRVAETTLGEGDIYHPGGLDFDGTNLWCAVAEYRPNSRSIVYRIDPQTLKATEVFRAADHIGAVVVDTDDRTIHGVSWGSRRFYQWTVTPDGRLASAEPASVRLNPSHYVDYQDCKYAGRHRMLCSGVAELRPSADAPPFRLGGIDLVDLRDGRPLHQVPVPLWTASGLDMTHNPVWIEAATRGLRAYFMPEDDTSTLYVYDVEPVEPRR